MLKAGQELSVELETEEPPFRIYGIFVQQDSEYIEVKGTVGDYMHDRILIPKSKVKLIRTNQEPEKKEDRKVVDSFMREVPLSDARFS